ncbi:hypothetical protein [Streptomyces aurantiacus]|uniref:hypothetical protein n=1 Tax=Streptomyces aurantiacus TaxID=47760 RepID=UPI0027D8567A|nr:hypothetical protein [Streptomyces aurantiacus]
MTDMEHSPHHTGTAQGHEHGRPDDHHDDHHEHPHGGASWSMAVQATLPTTPADGRTDRPAGTEPGARRRRPPRAARSART